MLETLISSPFEAEAYKHWLSSIFTTWNPRTLPTESIDHVYVSAYHVLGTTLLDDGRKLAIFLFELKDNVDLEHNRVSLHKVLESQTKEILADGAIAAFYKPSDPSVWRFSFLRFTYDENDKQNVTASRRFTYLLGRGIATKTAKEYLKKLVPFSLDKIQEAFSVERVSKEFFEEYRKLFEQVVEHLKPQKGLFESESMLHAYAKKLLGRIVFLYFLQKKGWMSAKEKDSWGSGDKNFISNLFREYPRDFYAKRLAPLFFETLNRKRDNDYSDIFDSYIPFLNGGLFDESKGLDDRVIIDDTIFAEVFGVFDRYNFTVIEDTPHDSEVAIDPEMLGRVFENLLEENYRKGKGAFYTPREIVHYMCRESLIDKLSQSFDHDAIKNLVINNETDNSYICRHAKEIETVVKSLKVLDPAIGSGAFPMGLLHELVAVLANLDKTANLAELKRSVIENSIYGVDIDPDAVEIAKLRFWLSLTVDEDTPTPLPNLFFKIMQGNSLIETIDGIDPIPTELNEPKTKKEQKTLLSPIHQAWNFDKVDAHDDILVLTKKLHQFFKASDRELKQRLQDEIFTVIKQILNQRIDELKRNIATLQSDLAVELTKTKTPIVERKVKKLTDDMFQSEGTMAKIEALKTSPISPDIFLYKLWFGEVLKEGGFDIVIGNPPYIRISKLKNSSIDYKKHNFKSFAADGDIYSLFYEKGINLLKNDGILCFITSNSWLRTKYGEVLKNVFNTQSNPKLLVNFEDTQIFESATVESNIFITTKSDFTNSLQAVSVDSRYEWGKSLRDFVKEHAKSCQGYQVGDENKILLMSKIENAGTLLKEWDITINYGVKTGFNEAFVIDTIKRNELILSDLTSSDLIKPILRGRDIQKNNYLHDNLWLISTFPSLKLNIDNYQAIKKYLQIFGARIEQSGEKGSRKKTNNKWFETQDQVGYWKDFQKPKIVWGEISDEPKFAYCDEEMFMLAPGFIMIGENLKYLTAVLNSKLSKWYFDQIATTTGMGTTMWKKYKLELLPVVRTQNTRVFEIMIDYISWLNRNEEPINKYVPNSHIAHEFETVIDGLIYELYFPEEFKSKGIELIKYAQRDFIDTENAQNYIDKAEIIHAAYQTLEERNNEIRNALIKLKIDLEYLLSPIIKGI